MATLAESFLADLEDLSDDSQDEDQRQEEGADVDMAANDVDALNYDNLDAVSQLATTERYQTIMQGVRNALSASEAGEGTAGAAWTGPSEEDPTYRLLVDCNALAVDIDNEIVVVHNFIRDKYRLRFPELESLVHNPIEYARVVTAIGNETDLTLVDLDHVLPPAAVMVITVTATTTTGKPLSQDDMAMVMDACARLELLMADKGSILELVQKKMHKIAPNLSESVGTEIAAQLMGAAGGLINLAKMPACNVQVLGANRKTLAGFSTASVQPHQGFIFACEIMKNTPPGLRGKCARMVGAKCTLMARVDAYGQDATGTTGREFKEEMLKKVEKWQEPPPAKTIKPLPAPDAEPRKRRGGRRYRKMKERYGLTDMRKATNRVNFNQQEEEFFDGEESIGLGVLGKEGSGRLRIVASQQRQKLTAKTAKKYKQIAGRSGATSGLSSSLAFTPVAGFELANPMGQQATELVDSKEGTESYFSEYSGFRSLKGKP